MATSLATAHGSPRSFALLFVLQLGPSALIGALGGPLVDRLPRKQLMIASDLLENVDPALLRHRNVEHDRIPALRAYPCEGLLAIGRARHFAKLGLLRQ